MSYVPAEAGTLLILLITGYKTCRCAAPFSGVVYQLTGKTTKVHHTLPTHYLRLIIVLSLTEV